MGGVVLVAGPGLPDVQSLDAWVRPAVEPAGLLGETAAHGSKGQGSAGAAG